MAKSGLETLLEALRNSGMDTDDIKGGSSFGGGTSAGATSAGAKSASGSSKSGSGAAGKSGRRSSGGGTASGEIPHFDLSFFDNVQTPKSKRGWIILIIAAVLIIAALYWWFHPPISIHSTSLWFLIAFICVIAGLYLWYRRSNYKEGKGKYEKSPKQAKKFTYLLAIPAVIIAIGLIGALLSLSIFPGNAEKYSNVLAADTLDFAQDIQEVNYSEIPVIDHASAVLLGNREMGAIPEYVSQFEVDDLYSQINYQGTPVRVSPLNYADIFKWFTNRGEGLPAYALVDMTTQDAEIVRLGEEDHIYYSQSEPLARNIDRYVQLKYPFYIFDELSFEIDEEGHAWWICPVREYTIGLFGGYTIGRVVLVDATTGECTDMAVEDVPEWVDRVYPAALLIEQYNWYGAYNNGWLNSFLGQEGVVQTTPGTDGTQGYNYIAKDDDVWVYTGVTSATADDSIIGFVLVNQRTQEAHFYSVAGATESSAMESAEGQVQNLEYEATFPLLINVANQPTYFMALKDNAGLVKKFAMIDIQRYQNVAVGDTVAETQQAYEALLVTNGVLSDEVDISGLQEASGTIATMAQAVIDSNSHFYITLDGEDALYDFPLPNMLDIVRYQVGDTIKFTYLTTDGENTAYSIEDE